MVRAEAEGSPIACLGSPSQAPLSAFPASAYGAEGLTARCRRCAGFPRLCDGGEAADRQLCACAPSSKGQEAVLLPAARHHIRAEAHARHSVPLLLLGRSLNAGGKGCERSSTPLIRFGFRC